MRRYLFLTVLLVLFLALAVNAFAATYYVKPDGNDNLDGRSDADAWQTIAKVNSNRFATGDDVYFKCGGTWTGTQLWVDWSGNSGDRAVIGAYYINGGTEVIGVSGDKPILDGNNTVPANDSYYGLIEVYVQHYTTVENLKTINSGHYGLCFEQGSNHNATNIETDHIYASGVRYKSVDTGVVEGCDITNTCRKALLVHAWPAALVLVRAQNIIIRNNTVHENYGEGIGVYTYSSDCLVEDNICYANGKAQIYVGHSRGNTVRRNFCYGTTDATFHRGDFPSLGIGITDEGWGRPYSENNKIYNNLIAYCSHGIFLWSSWPDWPLKDTNVCNNTVVDCGINLSLSRYRTAFENSYIRNNIFWSISSDSVQTSVPSNYSGLTIDYNLWSSAPNAVAQGANDPPYDAPQLSRTSGWRSMKGRDLKGSDFALQSTSPAINAGIPLSAEYALVPECTKSVWPTQIELMDQNEQGSAWEIGADIHVPNPTALDHPTGLRIPDRP